MPSLAHPEDSATTPRIVVIGGGISGLSAAWALSRAELARHPAARQLRPRITVLESSDRLGGKIQTSEFADAPVDTGPDAFLTRLPHAIRLVHEIGLDDELTSPAQTNARVWSRGHLHNFPARTLLGVPSSLRSLAASGLISPAGVARAGADWFLPGFAGNRSPDPSLADVIRTRLGTEVLERLVEPLIGSINAAPAAQLSLAAVAPQIAEVASEHRSLIFGARAALKERAGDGSIPPFAAPTGGMAKLITTLSSRLEEAGVVIRTNTEARQLARQPGGQWAVEVSDDEVINADAVLITTPGDVSATLLASALPEVAAELRAIPYASVAMVRLAYTNANVPGRLDGSGFVVPPVDGRLLTACSWASSKWAHLQRDGQVILRASVGRLGDDRAFQLSDEELITAVHTELMGAMGVHRRPFAADVTRWEQSFPQYAPGHGERVAAIEAWLGEESRLALAGAAYHGLGIPACIRSANEAADRLLTVLAGGAVRLRHGASS